VRRIGNPPYINILVDFSVAIISCCDTMQTTNILQEQVY
jgi:hypothetical protein